jgi:hypothetical protein
LVACFVRQALVFSLRKSGRDALLHSHESITFISLSWTCVACLLAMTQLVPSLSPGLTEAHLGLVLAPQVLTWYWCLQHRGEISKSDFTAHALGLAATFVLLLTGGFLGSVCAVGVSGFAVVKRSSFPRSRQSFFWSVMLVVSLQRLFSVPFAFNTWTLAAIEISMMYIIKIRLPMWFLFDKRFDSKVNTESQDFNDPSSLAEMQPSSSPGPTFVRRNGPLLSFDSGSEDGSSSPLPPPPDLIRTDSLGARSPLQLVRTDSLGQGRPPGSGHRRGISTQSSGSSWAWGLAVQDFVVKSLSPPSSSDEDDDLDPDLA